MPTLFKFPINYTYGYDTYVTAGTFRFLANNVSDNDYRTLQFSNEATQTFHVPTYGATETTNTQITHIYMRSENVDTLSVAVPSGMGTGTGITNQTLTNLGDDVLQYTLMAVGPLNATQVDVTVGAAGTTVYEIMLLEQLINFDNLFTRINPTRIDRGARIRPNMNGSLLTAPGRAGRHKWQTDFSAVFHADNAAKGNEFITAINGISAFTFEQNFTEFPERVYPATMDGNSFNISYIGRLYNQQQIDFTILEL